MTVATMERPQDKRARLVGVHLVELSNTVQTGKESLNTMTTEIQRLLNTGVHDVIKVVEKCEKNAKYFSDTCLMATAKMDEFRIESKELQAELQQAEEENGKMQALLKKCRNELHGLQSERSEALVALGMAEKSTTLNQAIHSAMQSEKKTLQCQLDELKAERASAELALNKKIHSLEAVRDGLLPAAGQLVVAQNKKRKWKQIYTTSREENARLRISEEALRVLTQRELEEEKDKRVCHICFVQPKDALLLPCLHLHFCHQCVDKFLKTNKLCPTCRSDVKEVLKCKV